MENIGYKIDVEHDTDSDEYIATMPGHWFVESEKTVEEVVHSVAKQLTDFANDYFALGFESPADDPKMVEQLKKALSINDVEKIKKCFDIRLV